MRITDIITESELNELSLAGIGQGIGKVVGGVGKAVGGVKGAIAGTKAAYSQGKQSAYNATHAAISGNQPPATPPSTPPGNQPPATPPSTPPGNQPPATTSGTSATNPFSDPVKLKQAFDDIAQQLTAAQANQLKPMIQSMYRQLGGVSEGIGSTIANKVMGRAPANTYQVGQVVKYEMDPPQPNGSGVGKITAINKSGDHYKIDGSKIVNHFEIKGIAEDVKKKGTMVKDFHSSFLGKDI